MDRIITMCTSSISSRSPLFNTYLNDLFSLCDLTEVCNFADHITFFVCDKDLRSLINTLERDSFLAIGWFQNNYMKLNEDKCHLPIAGHKYESIWEKITETKIWESNKQKLLGIQTDKS